MDSLSGLLSGPRANGAFLLRSVLREPWALRVRDEAPLTVAVLVPGSAWVRPAQLPPTQLAAGDVMIPRGPDHYTVASGPSNAPEVFIDPGQICTGADGRSLAAERALGPRRWGNDPEGSTVLVTGTYQSASAISDRLLRTLPASLVLRTDEWNGSMVDLLCAEMARDDIGQDVYLDRLLDLLVIAAVRAWFALDPSRAPGWWRAAGDPVVGPALRMIEDDLSHGWTVASLAYEVGSSRAAFARRFTDLLGVPPMSYLTGLRLTMAEDLLHEPSATVASVANRVGYSSPFALSAAFKRERGMSPASFRAAAR